MRLPPEMQRPADCPQRRHRQSSSSWLPHVEPRLESTLSGKDGPARLRSNKISQAAADLVLLLQVENLCKDLGTASLLLGQGVQEEECKWKRNHQDLEKEPCK
mmetsp:Transcript_73098/g.116277  ORF Transcript_73098/g.116277 Transcript_73098/m.116277 type:complete len:103 (+) Transcript_73098:65-373(+)